MKISLSTVDMPTTCNFALLRVRLKCSRCLRGVRLLRFYPALRYDLKSLRPLTRDSILIVSRNDMRTACCSSVAPRNMVCLREVDVTKERSVRWKMKRYVKDFDREKHKSSHQCRAY